MTEIIACAEDLYATRIIICTKIRGDEMKARKMCILMVFLTAILASASNSAAAPTLPSGIENPMLIRYPELTSAPAPSWLTEGTRATYNVLASTSESERTEDVEYGTGKPGYGLAQTDVVALEQGEAATFTQSYAPDLQNAMRPLLGTGSVAPAGCGDFWCNPDVLRRIPQSAADDLTVQRLPVTIAGKEYQAIRFDFRDDTLQMALVYDLATGVLLYHTFDYTSYNIDKEKRSLATSGTNAMLELRDLRQVPIPWKDGKVPAWLSPGEILSYQGQKAVQIQGAQPYSFPLSVQVGVMAAHNRFTEMNVAVYAEDPASAAKLKSISGIAQLLGFWMPPEAAADLSQGVIDTDPDTGMQVSLVQIDDNGIVFEKTNQQDYRAQFTYDLDGKLIQTVTEYNPDVMTSTGFGSVRVETLRLIN